MSEGKILMIAEIEVLVNDTIFKIICYFLILTLVDRSVNLFIFKWNKFNIPDLIDF
jgi:hypothetical protein